jgi:glucose-6-phosphate isomerase
LTQAGAKLTQSVIMIRVETNTARGFLNEGSYGQAVKKAEESLKQLRDKTGKGPEWLGWRQTLASPDDALLEEIDSLAASIRQEADIFIVCGIGGSYLGSKAVIEALGPELLPGKPEILYAGHNMSGRYLEELLAYISRPKEDGDPTAGVHECDIKVGHHHRDGAGIPGTAHMDSRYLR